MKKIVKELLNFAPIFLASLIFFDSTGMKVEITKVPQRIISLSPSITESLFELGIGDRIVGVTIYCNRPPEAKSKEKVGTLLNVNLEKIITLKPDIIFIGEEGNRPEIIRKLRKVSINVFAFGKVENFKKACQDFQMLGEIAGRKNRAKNIVKEITKKMEEIKKRIKNMPPVKVFCQLGSDPIVTAGKGTFIDELIHIAGGINIAHNITQRYARFSREQVIKKNPDVIIIVTMGEYTEKEKKTWYKFKELPAVKNNRIYIIDADLVCRPAPTVLIEGLKEIAKCIHQEVFK
ncbi:hypothetical protein AUJ66_04040 [Candidatus Desantisbacteria bacterium CG1_02_38_46]|uniref:ABC transporter substrate-binding protein n=2 Tax=unclassified Candidatus Desantisiibacteriota TaxID=3106372 RepID=A0A2H9PD43_9BACT|nr:MAG: hypothetical protein AUJ66_04040 [Candidatus Desantisbacteria bacterium CG1_02_38_46]PIZ16204.1 MAG: ABC transporter substrate-binding protein [Candidatus Desantisbacteria bacterium CG_4_10_14_0_8_um_filter_39_17]